MSRLVRDVSAEFGRGTHSAGISENKKGEEVKVSPEYERIIDMLMPALIGCAMKYDGSTPPDEAARRILRSCVGSAFVLGVAYGEVGARTSSRDRLTEAFKRVEADG